MRQQLPGLHPTRMCYHRRRTVRSDTMLIIWPRSGIYPNVMFTSPPSPNCQGNCRTARSRISLICKISFSWFSNSLPANLLTLCNHSWVNICGYFLHTHAPPTHTHTYHTHQHPHTPMRTHRCLPMLATFRSIH